MHDVLFEETVSTKTYFLGRIRQRKLRGKKIASLADHAYIILKRVLNTGGLVICTMSRNPIPEKAAVSPPSLPAFLPSIIATAVLSLALGYWVGVGNSFLSFGSSKNKRRSTSDDGASSSSEISSEDETDLTDNRLRGVSHEECKLVRFLHNFDILM